MNAPTNRTPPRFVPTLTEVIEDRTSVDARPAATVPAAAAQMQWITPQMQEALVQRVLERVADVLEPRLSDTVAAIARQHSEAMAQHLGEKIEDVVSELVADAVQAELSALRHR